MVVSLSKNVFVTFGAGRTGWIGAAKRITAEAKETELFEFCFNLDENWLKTWDPAIYRIGLNLRKNQSQRGFGFWTWKPSVLLWAHLNFPNFQITYVDAGSEFLDEGIQSLRQDLKDSNLSGGLAWSLPKHPEKCWTKAELIERLSVSELDLQSDQIQAGFISLPVSKKRETLITQWRAIAFEQDGFYFTDESKQHFSQDFKEHRHDQSVLSCLWKMQALPYKSDKTSPHQQNTYGLVAKRNNSRFRYKSKIRYFSKYVYLLIDIILSRRNTNRIIKISSRHHPLK
jgi:hypothetical protein